MKSKITLILLLSLITYAANAQFPPYYFGLKAAPQISWMKPDVDGYEGNGAKMGFVWGFLAEFNFTETHSIASGFNMLFNGGKIKFPATVDSIAGTINREYDLKYIEIPLTLKMRTKDMNGMRYFGRIGLGTAFNISAKKTDKFTSTTGTVTTGKKETYDNISFVRESLIVGLGCEHEIKEGPKFGAELTFNNGFTDILTEKDQKAVPSFFELAISVIF
jgi:hypothetical protein